MIKIVIDGDPVAKKRPRFAVIAGRGRAYSDQQTDEGLAVLAIKSKFKKEPLTGPLTVSFAFYIRRPKGHFGTGKNSGRLKDSAPTYPAKKPDIDNMVKFYLDCMNMVVFGDDSSVIYLNAKKLYSDGEPYTLILIDRL